MNPIFNIQKSDLTQSAAQSIANQIAIEVEEGYADPCIALAYAKWFSVLAEAITKHPAIKEAALNLVDSTGKGGYEIHGFKFKIMEAGTRYDFTESEAWTVAQAELKEIEKLAKTISNPTMYTLNSGEQLEVQPAPKYSTTTVTTTLPKE